MIKQTNDVHFVHCTCTVTVSKQKKTTQTRVALYSREDFNFIQELRADRNSSKSPRSHDSVILFDMVDNMSESRLSSEERADIIKVNEDELISSFHNLRPLAFGLNEFNVNTENLCAIVLQEIMAQNEVILAQHRQKLELEVTFYHSLTPLLSLQSLSCHT